MSSILLRTAKALITCPMLKLTYMRQVLPHFQANTLKTGALLTGGLVLKQQTELQKAKEKTEADAAFLGDVKTACNKNDESLKELMQVLHECITEISREYQSNIKKQIEIIKKCTNLGPVGEHWDQLTEYRVTANELRQELTKYEILVQKVGQMAYNQAVTSLLSGIENAMDLLEVNYHNLENAVTQLSKDNYQWEAKLLYANRDSILTQLK